MLPNLLTIHPLTLLPNQSVNFDVLVWDDQSRTAIKFLEADQKLSKSKFDCIAMRDGQKCYIELRDNESYREYLHRGLMQAEVDQRIPAALKLTLLLECIRFKLQDAFDSGSLSTWIDSAYELAHTLSERLTNPEKVGRDLLGSLRKDGSFATHAFNTGIYCYLLSRRLMLSSTDTIEFTVGGILHDVGKLGWDEDYPDQIYLPEGYLDANSSTSQRGHPLYGFRRLAYHPKVTHPVLMSIYQHHERQDGRGYPVGIGGRDIELGSRICSVANRWDGLMCDRRGRQGMSRLAALRSIESEKSLFWDSEIVGCLEQVMNPPSNR
jgi:HD-GYP domain-containing protein (c-di-GMP phosphodiesterase class II)